MMICARFVTERRTAVIGRTLLLAASAVASAPATAESGALDGSSAVEAGSTPESVVSSDDGSSGSRDGIVSGRLQERRALQPRWIEPRRLGSVGGRGSDLSAAPGPETASALPVGVGPVLGGPLAVRAAASEPERDWRYAARIVIHGERVNDELSTLTADLLMTLGAEAVEHRRVRQSSDVDQIRYFDAADEGIARQLAAALEPEFGRLSVRDFTAYRPSPDAGLLEMWLR